MTSVRQKEKHSTPWQMSTSDTFALEDYTDMTLVHQKEKQSTIWQWSPTSDTFTLEDYADMTPVRQKEKQPTLRQSSSTSDIFALEDYADMTLVRQKEKQHTLRQKSSTSDTFALEDYADMTPMLTPVRQKEKHSTPWQMSSTSDTFALEGYSYMTPVRQNEGHRMRQKYLQLPARIQQCFAYLSIYPKEWRFKPEDVIQMWMAQGMIGREYGEIGLIKDIGEDYFIKLVSESFFRYYDDHYIIANLQYDLAEYVSKDDCFRVDGDEFRTIPTTVRHLFLNTKHLARLKKKASVLNKLRTLILQGDFSVHPNDADHLQEVIVQLKSIRMLTLKNCNLERCPDNLSSLTHLRYLDLSGNGKIKKLSDELAKLYHLQTLNLFQLECDSIHPSMNKLINLHSLNCSDSLLSMIAGIGKLTSLQDLPCPFYVQNVPGFDIGQLGKLRKLGGRLSIMGLENVSSEEEAKGARLCEKENLVELVLHWGYVERTTNPKVEKRILDGLQPHPHLRKLHIDGYIGTQSPSWMNQFKYLKSLKLTDCRSWEGLPPLGHYDFLEVLELSEMHAVRKLEFHDSRFPSLRELAFDDLRNCEVWSTVEGVELFPRLRILRISDCPQLTTMPPLPDMIERLELFNVGLNEFPESLTEAWGSPLAVTLSIKGCPKLQSPGEWLLEQHGKLRYLGELTVDPCGELDPLLVKAINKFTRLRKLCIDNWPSDQNLGEEEEEDEEGDDEKYKEEEDVKYKEEEDSGLLLDSLKSLKIINCDVADNILSKSLQGLSALESLRIDWCSVITTLSFEKGQQKLTQLVRLEITNCRGLQSLVGLGALCSLHYLKVVGCPKLTPLPCSGSNKIYAALEKVGLSTLSTLFIDKKVGLSALCIDNTLLLEVLLSRKSLRSLKQLEIIFSDQQEIEKEVFHHLRSLQSLRFEACHNLKTLPSLKNLRLLEKLEIKDCRNFRSLPSEKGRPPLLTHLSVRRCHPEYKD
ncbi:putative disease resistance RPP13-like protein 1 [Typha latifolia]|uniref:putative disease resistance RPP13-like protein 1 n=1 Tax=Typha latifolia TaxID=4733 RepID=UPI003C2FCA27